VRAPGKKIRAQLFKEWNGFLWFSRFDAK